MPKFCLLLPLAALMTFGKDPGASLTVADAQQQIRSQVSQEHFAPAQWGVKIVSLETGALVFETNSGKLLKPASNAKLFTGALALEMLGPSHQIHTSVYAERKPSDDGVLSGDLIIFGRGDFSFAARFHEDDYGVVLDRMVHAITNAGIRTIGGNLVGDATFFRGPPFGASWTWDDLQYYYGAEVSALTLQDNVIDLFFKPSPVEGSSCDFTLKPRSTYLEFVNRTRTTPSNSSPRIEIHRPLGQNLVYLEGSLPLGHRGVDEAVTVSNPALWFVTQLKEALNRAGVEVRGHLKSRSWPADAPLLTNQWTELAHVKSPPLSLLVEKMMKPSQNLYAQLLLLQVGAASPTRLDTNLSTEDAGLRELREFMKRAGISPREVLLEEGSGLSRGCLVTPNSIVQLLRHMHGHRHSTEFRASLPQAGEDGTLRNRLKDLQGNVRAKTGTIRYVNSLSGYMQTAAGEPLAFSIMLNAYSPSPGAKSSRDEIDEVVRLLARIGERIAHEAP